MFKGIEIQKLLNQIHVRQQHPAAAIPLQTQDIQGLPSARHRSQPLTTTIPREKLRD